MPFINTPGDYRFAWYLRPLWWLQKRRYGAVLEPTRLWARTPKVFLAEALLYAALIHALATGNATHGWILEKIIAVGTCGGHHGHRSRL
jgi:hypothetical protein